MASLRYNVRLAINLIVVTAMAVMVTSMMSFSGLPRNAQLFELLSERWGNRAHTMVLHHGPSCALATLSH